MRLGKHGDAEGARGCGLRQHAREDGEAERVALARAGRALYDEHAVCEVRADDRALRVGQSVRRLRARGETRELLRIAQTFGADGARALAFVRVAQPSVEVVVARVAAGIEELVGVEVVRHLVGRVEPSGLGRKERVPVPEGRVLEAHREQTHRRAVLGQLFDQREPPAHQTPRR